MKKLNLLLLVFIFFAGNAICQTLPEGMIKLTPDNVELTVGDKRSVDKEKNMVVAGKKGQGYKAFFTAKDADHGEELWVTDGTPQGTKMVKDIFPGPSSSDVAWMQRFNDKVVFQAQSDIQTGVELWISDGTEAGTYMVKDIHDFGSSNPAGFTQVNETQFIFAAMDFDSEIYNTAGEQRWLWVSDGTEDGTTRIMECNVGFPGTETASDAEQYFCRVGRQVYFKADTKDNTVGEELWITDGTEAGTRLVKDINTEAVASGTAKSALDHFTNFYNEKLFFKAWTLETGNEPFMSDGTEEGTTCIYDTDPTFNTGGKPNGGGVFTPRVWNDKVYFRGYHPQYGKELVSTDMTKGNYVVVSDINKNPTETGTASSFVDLFCPFDGVMFMKAQFGQDPHVDSPKNYGLELTYTDGTDVGTIMQSDLNPGIESNFAWEGMVVSGSFYFRAQDETPPSGTAWNLFRINSKDEKPVKVMDLSDGNDVVHTLRNLDGDLIFTSMAIPALFKYNYRKPNYDPTKDTEDLDINYNKRGESSINSISKESNQLAIYPNPTTDYFYLQNEVEGTVKVNILDLTGKTVYTTDIQADEKVDVSLLSKGIYMVILTDSTGEISTTKLILK